MTNIKQKKLSSEDRKTQILNAARSLFAKKGYNKTTLDDIANHMCISRPRVIQLFGSKRGIYEAIAKIAYQAHPMDKDLAEPIQEKNDFVVFKAFASHILHHTAKREDREMFKILMYARLKEDHFHRVHFHKKDTLMISRLSDYVRERIQEGAFKEMDHRTIIYAYQDMISNLAIYKNVLKEMEFVNIDELSRDCARIFLEGIVVSQETPH
ncbi:MAG: TetR/AcrR family transcriptional regulator [Proteobacteria bacterium]|nr:TetR/AcrR family transcriptional regulator [Pseudomonadota bacterium]